MRLLVVQPYVPAYRVPLFDLLAQRVRAAGGAFLVVHGPPPGAQARRRDAHAARWSHLVPEWRVGGGRLPEFVFRRIQPAAKCADVVVSELAATAVHSLLLTCTRPDSVVLWGHGKNYVAEPSALDYAVEARMARAAAVTMTYTESGRQSLIERGVPATKVRTLRNSTDTRRLREAAASTSEADLTRLRRDLGIGGRCALFVGGLDATKRVDFLLAAGRRAAELSDGFRLVMCGSGDQDDIVVATARREPWLVHFPTADAQLLGQLSHLVDAVWMPGRIGLVAADAIALRLPVLTTASWHHAPEAEYLQLGVNRHNLPDDPASFAAAYLARDDWRPLADLDGTVDLSIEGMADRFLAACTDAFAGSENHQDDRDRGGSAHGLQQ
ncbi:MAG: glycosyltransferase [Actinomycetota bacterium]|nr:MAG: glycosyltransferase [Actinomycetota bacterium]